MVYLRHSAKQYGVLFCRVSQFLLLMLSVIMLNVIMLSVILLNVVMLNVMASKNQMEFKKEKV